MMEFIFWLIIAFVAGALIVRSLKKQAIGRQARPVFVQGIGAQNAPTPTNKPESKDEKKPPSAEKPTVTTTSYVPSELLSKALPWLITIAIICGIIYILPSPPKVQGKVDVSWLNTIDLGIAFAVVITLGLFYLVLNGKGGLPAAIALCIIVASFFFFGDDVFKVLKTVQKETAGAVLGTTQSSKAKNAERVINGEAIWKDADGRIPVGVWSEPIEIPVRCGITFSGGYSTIYVVQYQNYSDKWNDLMPKEFQPMNKFRFKVLKEGETSRPFTMECKPRPY